MASFNKVILLGNLTRDPEVRYTPKGSAVCDLGIAVNRVYTTESGERREEVTFVDVVSVGTPGRDRRRIFEKGQTGFYRRPSPNGQLGRQADWAKADQTSGRR